VIDEPDPDAPRFDEFARHEVLHTAGITIEFWEQNIGDHPVVKADPQLQKEAMAITDAIIGFYQLCGAKFLSPGSEEGAS
jgi:hypothetical protein